MNPFACVCRVILLLASVKTSWPLAVPEQLQLQGGPLDRGQKSGPTPHGVDRGAHAEEGRCVISEGCWTEYNTLMFSVFQFDLAALADSQASCSSILSALCKTGRCDEGEAASHPRQPGIQAFTASVVEWVCGRQPEFRRHRACWASPFQSRLIPCLVTSSRQSQTLGANNNPFTALRTCFAAVVQSLPACTYQAQEFFIEFSDHVFDLQMNAATL